MRNIIKLGNCGLMGSYIFKFTEKFDFDRLKDVFEAVQGVITNGIYLLKETFIRVVTP